MKLHGFFIINQLNRLSFVVVLFLLLSLPLYATDYYVDKNATGGNNGTSWTNAWTSFSAIQWSSINPGDNLYISGGSDSTVYYETLSIQASGTSGNLITIKNGEDAGHTGTVIIDCQYTRSTGIYVGASYSYLTIDGVTITNIDGAGNNAGIEIFRSDYITMQNITITNFRRYGIFVNGYTDRCNEIKLYNSFVENEDGTTYNYQTDNVYIQYTDNFKMGGCTIIHNYNGYPTQHSDAFQANFIGGIFDLYNNWVETAGASGAEDDNNNWIMGYINGLVRVWNNVILGSKSDLMWHAIQIRGGDAGYSNRTEFYNNYVEARGNNEKALNLSGGDVVVKNNIFVSKNQPALRLGSVDTVSNVDYNIYYSATGTIINQAPNNYTWSEWQSAGFDPNGYNVEPSLNSIYAPDAVNDPSVNKGTSISPLFTDDKTGVSRPQGFAWDIGPYEYVQGPDTTQPEVSGVTLLSSITLKIMFSEMLDETIAVNKDNYYITNNIEVLDAHLSGGSHVTLTTSEHSLGINYTVTVINVEDLAGNVISPQANSADYEYEIQLDVIPPILELIQVIDPDEIILDFSEPLDPNSVQNLGNYTISGQIDVLNASLSEDGKRISLSTTSHIPEYVYTIELQNLTDTAGNVISSAGNSSFYKYLEFPSSSWNEYLIESVTALSTSDTNTSPNKTLDGLGTVDPDPNSRWASLNMPQWIQYDLGSIKPINLIPISFYRWDQGRLYQYSIQTSIDESQWTEIISNATSSNQEWTINEFSSVDARFIRIICLSSNESDWAGLWEARILGPETNVNLNTTPIVVDFELFQNYPNPFNPVTSIKYTIPSAQYASLKVFDVLGNEVATLVSEVKPAGSYEIMFNATNLPSGVYFYRLQANNLTQVKKMILLK